MNSHQSAARKNMDVMTFVVIVLMVTAVLGAVAYVTMTEVVPALHHFQTQLTSAQPINQK